MENKLSIIIPAYNAEKYLYKLLDVLNDQMQKGVEVLIVDDGSRIPVETEYKWARVFRKKNGGPGMARNVGLDNAKGEYIAFIDADDLITNDYLPLIMEKIKEGFDYCYLSWQTLPGGWDCKVIIDNKDAKFPPYNLCVWNRVYHRSLIENLRFSPDKLWSEDADFIYRLNERGKKTWIDKPIYLYRSDTPDSWTKKMMSGRLPYTRIVYNVKEVTPDLFSEIRKEYQTKEIVCCTNKPCENLNRYAMILPYNTGIKGTELRGDFYPGFSKIERPKETQVLIWTANTALIGGIETWIYNFCVNMYKYYDIIVMYDDMVPQRIEALYPYVEVIKRTDKKIVTDTLIVNRITDHDPPNVDYKQKIQMVHICQMGRYKVPTDNDITVYVSDHCKKTYDAEEGAVIHNMTAKKRPCPLLLVSAMRTTYEKGMERMVKLSELMTKYHIYHKWLLFTDGPIKNATPSMIRMNPSLDIQTFLSHADYLVQLSDEEAFCYVILEALESGTAVITTPLGILEEIGFKDRIHGYILPFNIDDDCHDIISSLNDVPDVSFKWNNYKIRDKWREILGDTKPTRSYKPGSLVKVRATQTYYDIVLQRQVNMSETIQCTMQRGKDLEQKKLGRIEA